MDSRKQISDANAGFIQAIFGMGIPVVLSGLFFSEIIHPLVPSDVLVKFIFVYLLIMIIFFSTAIFLSTKYIAKLLVSKYYIQNVLRAVNFSILYIIALIIAPPILLRGFSWSFYYLLVGILIVFFYLVSRKYLR